MAPSSKLSRQPKRRQTDPSEAARLPSFYCLSSRFSPFRPVLRMYGTPHILEFML